jgi:hypothetical protein
VQREESPLTRTTLAKALTIYQRGGVEWTGAYSYRVTSTSGEVHGAYPDLLRSCDAFPG